MADDDEYPTLEEAQAFHKKLFGDKVVQMPAQPKQTDNPILDMVNDLNLYFATTLKNAKFKVIDERIPNQTEFLDASDFIREIADQKMTVYTTDPNGGTKSKFEPKSKIWLEHPHHRKYRSVIFDPRRPHNKTDPDYNTWPGFIYDNPKRGHCYQFLQYVKNVLCNGNKAQYRWLMAWCAHIFQKPWEKPETAVAIQGEEEGSGKSFFPSILSRLLNDKSYFAASNAKMITGDFSGHLEYVILLHAEEAFRAESEREDSIIKNLISDERIGINAKGVEAKLSKNYIRLLLTGNPPHIVKAGRFARRFLVLKISDKHLLDTNYFMRLSKMMANGGYEALMYYFMHYPLDKYNLRVVLKTEGLLEQKLESMRAEERFWYNKLYTGEIICENYNKSDDDLIIFKYKMFSNFQRFMNKRVEKNRSDEVKFGMIFTKFFPIVINSRIERGLRSDKYENTNCYHIPELNVARQMFDIYFRQPCGWPNDGGLWQRKSSEEF
jgi:hypothetical protein